MMHLKFPRNRKFLRWDELGCLARALGFHENLFVNNLPEELIIGRLGVTIQEFLDMFDLHKYFNAALDRTSNIHTDEWNIHSIKKVIQLLDKHVFTFEEIEMIRLAYEVYESSATRGMCVEEKVLQRAIKMCGRMISPQKMLQRIKHMAARFEEPDHMQLHEFLDLLLWCQMYEGIIVKAEDLNVNKDDRELFELEDFEQLLSFYDQRLASDLDDKYKKDELKFVKEKFGSKRMPRDVPPVDQEIRKKQVWYHKCRYRSLHNEIGDSTRRVDISRAGYVRDRPISAPDLTMYEHVDPSIALSALDVRQTSVMEMFGHLIRPASAGSFREKMCPRPDLAEYTRPKTPCAVAANDVVDTNNRIDSLQYEMETIDMKYQNILEEDLDYLMPGYRERMANRPQTAPEPPPPRPKCEARPTEQTLRRLAHPFKHGLPLPSHAKACDARYRGWHSVKTKPGPHYVLCSSSFENSPNGTLLAKLQKTANTEIKRKPLIYRYTHPHQVVTPSPRPHTSPAVMMNSPKADRRSPRLLDCNDNSCDVQILNLEGKPKLHQEQEERSLLQEHAKYTSQTSQIGNGGDSDLNRKDLMLNGSVQERISETQNTAINKVNTKSQKEGPPTKTERMQYSDCTPRQMRTNVLEDIKELEEDEGSVRGLIDVAVVPGNKTTGIGSPSSKADSSEPRYLAKTGHLAEVSFPRCDEHGTPARNLKMPGPEVVSENYQQGAGCKQEHTTSRTADYIDPWFRKNSGVKQYEFVLKIMNTDFSERDREKKEKYNYRRLSRRGQGNISKQLSKKLVKGITA